MSDPTSRRKVVAEATRDPEARAQLRALLLHAMAQLYRESPPGVQGSLDRTLASLDSDLEPDHPLSGLVAAYREGRTTRAQLLSDPGIRARLASRWGAAAT